MVSTGGRAPAPIGDPLNERDGIIPPAIAHKADTPSRPGGSPETALERYALLYTNWQADNPPAVEYKLAALATGAARLAVEQTAASEGAATALAANHVHNKDAVIAIAPGQGVAKGQWVIVTRQQTTGAGPYAGLPATVQVTSCAHREGGGRVGDQPMEPSDVKPNR
jgi:hypothetical protein